jgi:putative MFS transporter
MAADAAILSAGGPALRSLAFWCGTVAVVAGVILHLPFFFHLPFPLAAICGAPMTVMNVGMGLILAGTALAAGGLLPPGGSRRAAGAPAAGIAADRAAQPLTTSHVALMATLAVAMVIDTMKPASIGFVVPGMRAEYHLARGTVAILPVFALTGTLLGSYVWGVLADVMGRRAAILLAGLMFIGTSICGAMPTFFDNVVMCFLMGLSAGGMLPIAFTLLAETVPARHRGWSLVLLGGIGTAGGYLAASWCASLLEPRFGWRVMWLLGLPTGVLLIGLNRFMPESPSFLMLHGRFDEAARIIGRFGWHQDAADGASRGGAAAALFSGAAGARTLGLNAVALAWGLVNFGVILWLPADLRARGFDVGGSDRLLAESSLLALPSVAIAAWLYAAWNAKRTVILLCLLTVLGLVGVAALSALPSAFGRPVILVTVLMIGSNGIIAVLLPFSAEQYATSIRGRGTGLVAGSSKLGGVAAQLLTMAALVPALSVATVAMAVPVLASAALLGSRAASPLAATQGDGRRGAASRR